MLKALQHVGDIVFCIMKPSVVRPRNARIVRSAQDEVREIQRLLSDVYRDTGDGRTLLRELVQNADDAGARRLVFVVVEKGLPDARNTLLRGPALLVANDGPLPEGDWRALHQALGNAKAEDTGKIGRFGLGLKSVFHICEAFVYLGAEDGHRRIGSLNPWAGTGKAVDADPIHPDWNTVEDVDLYRLLHVVRTLLGSFENGLLLWIPLRRREHLDRAEEGQQYGLGQVPVDPENIVAWFDRPESLTLLLVQCGHLRSIKACRAPTICELRNRVPLVCVDRPHFESCDWVGRYRDDDSPCVRTFEGRIDDNEQCSVTGIDAIGLNSLRQLRLASEWPVDRVFREGRARLVPRKALAHAAITILHRQCEATNGVRLRWAVFLPLDDAPQPHTSNLVETMETVTGSGVWDIVMHGYFWPSHDRRSIPSVTDNHDDGQGESRMRGRWNRRVRDELMLPLIPQALEHAVHDVPGEVAWNLIKAVAETETVRKNISSITKNHVLLPVVTETGVRWKSHSASGARVLAIPSWADAPCSVRFAFLRRIGSTKNFIFIDGKAPQIGGKLEKWKARCIEGLLSCVSVDVLKTPRGLAWAEQYIRPVLMAQKLGKDDEISATVARWLAERVSEGAHTTATNRPPDIRQEMRETWRRVYKALPAAWLINAPINSHRAVAELATEGIVGPGLLPMPLGKPREAVQSSRPDPERLDRALLELGQRLMDWKSASKRARQSRLMLAEALLTVRDDRPFGDDLPRLPLLRALRLPKDKDEAWSVDELHGRTRQHRVFARRDEQTAETQPKQAVKELAEAVGTDLWLVDRAIAATNEVPQVMGEALANAVLRAEAIRSVPVQRIPFLRRLSRPENDADPTVDQALRTLLTGTPAGAQHRCDLYYVRSRDTHRDTNWRTLEILLTLRGQKWRAIEPELVAPLRLDLVERLQVQAVDPARLQLLLGEVLRETTETTWSQLRHADVLHLLRCLYGTTPEDRQRWRKMPLHRGINGVRGHIDDRTLRATDDGRLPPEIEAEIRVLEPDSDIEDLYRDVPPLDADSILRTMLNSKRPYRFADNILSTLYSDSATERQVILPRDSQLRDLIKTSPWLPGTFADTGLAPAVLIDLPEELSSLVDPLVGALGKHRMAKDVISRAWSTAREVVHEILERPSPVKQFQRFVAALDTDAVAKVDDGRYLVLPRAKDVDLELIEDALQSPLVDSFPGWSLVRAALRTLGGSGRGAVLALSRALCSPVPVKQQVSMLKIVAKPHPGKDSPGGRLFRHLVRSFSQTDVFISQVLPSIKLPTQAGHWRPAAEISRSSFGVARRHKIVPELLSALRLDNDKTFGKTIVGKRRIEPGGSSADVLARYFDSWKGHLNPGAVGAFLALLGNGRHHAILELAQDWFGADNYVENVRRDLTSANEEPCKTVKVSVPSVARGDRVEAVNILGQLVEMEADSDNETIYATEPVRGDSMLGEFWTIRLHDVEPHRRTGEELTKLLGNTVEWWAVRVLRLGRRQVEEWWRRWGTGSQAQVGPVRASILAHLPLTLRQLNVQECEALHEAVKNAERAQRKREQAPRAESRDAMDTERRELDRLAKLIPEHSAVLRGRVRQLIERFGYGSDSVLLELVQNADDALAQAAEIAGGQLPQAARKIVVRVHKHNGVTTVDLKHFGRPINDTGGASFPAGQDRQWDQDLYFMLLMNLSGKPGEAPGQSAKSSTTGRFGLGFKSVHLVSESPSVVSGYLAFSISGGLLPKEKQVPNDLDLAPVESQRVTRIRLPLRSDVDVQELIEKIFHRFDRTRPLLPAFAREFREIVVEGGPYAGISMFDGEPVEGAPGWSVARKVSALPGDGMWRILRFRPGSAGNDAGTAALVVSLRDGVPKPLPSDLPFLWNVTPTSEVWGCGYAVNGPFKLDPGRTHVSLNHESTVRVVDRLGDALGEGLVALHDALDAGVGLTSGLPVERAEITDFVDSLWRILASGINSSDELRCEFLRRLHGPGRGLSAWMCARSVVPSGLPKPFRERLPSLTPEMRIESPVHDLDDSNLCSALAQVEDLARLARGHLVVSGEVAQRLRPLLDTEISQLKPSDIFRELANDWNDCLTPERLNALRPLIEDTVWEMIADRQRASWYSKFVAQSAAGEWVPLRELLLHRELNLNDLEHPDPSIEDELRRAAFAPDALMLDRVYIAEPDDVTMFLRLRSGHRINAATMAGWFAGLPKHCQLAALRYLLHGRLKDELLRRLVPTATRPLWLDNYDDVSRMLDNLDERNWRRQALLAALFPDHFQDDEPDLPAQPDSDAFFDRIQEWWNCPNVRDTVIEKFEQKAWPDWLRQGGIADGLQGGSQDHWLALLILGACQGLGRAKESQHRGFLDLIYRNGLWEVFKNPDVLLPWMKALRTWQDEAVENLEYSRWMSLFPSIFQLSRYWEIYRRLLCTADRRPEHLYNVTCLLAPRVDDKLTGAGQNFDAPPAPLNMGLHWILRELVRLDVLDRADHLLPDCWVPSEQVLSFLRHYGLKSPEGSSSNSDKARAVFAFLASKFDTTTPHLHYAFDIPLRHVAADSGLQQHLDWEG